MKEPGLFGDHTSRMDALRDEILAEQQAQAEEKRRLEEAVRRTVREEIRSVLAEVREELLNPSGTLPVTKLDDVRSRLEARWADDGQTPGSTV